MEGSSSDRWLAVLQQHVERAAAGSTPSDEESTKQYARALWYLGGVLGRDWLEREVDGPRSSNFLLLSGDPEVEGHPDDKHERLRRTYLLAYYLDIVGRIGVEGFSAYVETIRRRQLVDVMAELRAAWHARRSGGRVVLLPESTTPGERQPDMRLILDEGDVWVEVKAKGERQGEYRPSKVENSLRTARGQIPASGPGLIYLQVPPEWGDDRATLASVEATTAAWLRSTTRVNAVVILLERRLALAGGGTRVLSWDVSLSSEAPRSPHAGLDRWLRSLGEEPLPGLP